MRMTDSDLKHILAEPYWANQVREGETCQSCGFPAERAKNGNFCPYCGYPDNPGGLDTLVIS